MGGLPHVVDDGGQLAHHDVDGVDHAAQHVGGDLAAAREVALGDLGGDVEEAGDVALELLALATLLVALRFRVDQRAQPHDGLVERRRQLADLVVRADPHVDAEVAGAQALGRLAQLGDGNADAATQHGAQAQDGARRQHHHRHDEALHPPPLADQGALHLVQLGQGREGPALLLTDDHGPAQTLEGRHVAELALAGAPGEADDLLHLGRAVVLAGSDQVVGLDGAAGDQLGRLELLGQEVAVLGHDELLGVLDGGVGDQVAVGDDDLDVGAGNLLGQRGGQSAAPRRCRGRPS